MRVLVLGAGLLGVTSAYYLQQLGHEVTVVDRHATPAAKARGLATTASPQAPRAAAAAPRRGKPLSRLCDGIRRGLARILAHAGRVLARVPAGAGACVPRGLAGGDARIGGLLARLGRFLAGLPLHPVGVGRHRIDGALAAARQR